MQNHCEDIHFKQIGSNFSFPTSFTIDNEGVIFVAESGLRFDNENLTHPCGGRIWAITPQKEQFLFAEGFNPPVNGLTFYKGSLYISEGGHPASISKIDLNTLKKTTIVSNLPGPGNYHANMVAFGPDEKLYFGQGAMTNSGIIGLDSYELGWLRRLPHAFDIPGYDIALTGYNAITENRTLINNTSRTSTGAFVQFGTQTVPGQQISGKLPCTASIMRCNIDGTNLELFAWGLRNPYGIGFLPNGKLIATDQGADDRGSRPIGNAPDLLFEVKKDKWYGWPDFVGGIPVNNTMFQPKRGPLPSPLISNHNELPPPQAPLLSFPNNCAAVKFDVMPTDVPDRKSVV